MQIHENKETPNHKKRKRYEIKKEPRPNIRKNQQKVKIKVHRTAVAGTIKKKIEKSRILDMVERTLAQRAFEADPGTGAPGSVSWLILR